MVMLVVLGVLTVVGFFLIEPPEERMKWTGVSIGVWIAVALVQYIAFGRVEQLYLDQSREAYLAPIRRAEAEGLRLRAELDQYPERRREALDGALRDIEPEAARSYEKIERFLVFGDPASAPGQVVVWGVLTMRPERQWIDFGYHGERLHEWLNWRLRLLGYPAKIALGFAPTQAVDSAGGDAAYFGPDAAALIPQYLPGHQKGAAPPPLDFPTRRSSR